MLSASSKGLWCALKVRWEKSKSESLCFINLQLYIIDWQKTQIQQE